MLMPLYCGAHAMCIDNSKLKKFKLGNGTLCRVISIRLKDNAPLQWKNWDGYKVYTISARYCEYVEFEHFPENERIVSLKSKINGLNNELEEIQDDEKAS